LRALTAALTLAKQEGAAVQMVTVEELPWFPASIDEVEEEKTEANHRLAPLIDAARAGASSRRRDRDPPPSRTRRASHRRAREGAAL